MLLTRSTSKQDCEMEDRLLSGQVCHAVVFKIFLRVILITGYSPHRSPRRRIPPWW